MRRVEIAAGEDPGRDPDDEVARRLESLLGGRVRIVDGPFETFEGVVQDLSLANRSVQVVITVFGRQVPVWLEIQEVEAAE